MEDVQTNDIQTNDNTNAADAAQASGTMDAADTVSANGTSVPTASPETANPETAGDDGNDALTGATASDEAAVADTASPVVTSVTGADATQTAESSAAAEPAPAAEAPAAEAPTAQAPVAEGTPRPSRQPSMAQVMESDEFSSYMSGVDSLQRGALLKGIIVRVDENTGEALVDVGTKSEGIIARNEMGDEPVGVGDEIEVVVLRPEDDEGHPVLSKRRADYEKTWRVIQQAKDKQTNIEGTVREQVKGGLIVDLGVPAFVPASHVDSRNRGDLGRFVGRTVPVRVIEIDRKKNKVIASHRLAAQEDREKREAEVWAGLEKDKIVEGVVRRITDFGAFVDIGGLDGLLHVREMAWSRVEHPENVVKKGQKLQVLILEIDEERKRVALGLKQLQSDPWKKAAQNLRPGQMVKGKIVRLAPACAFVELEEGVEGIIPISEMSQTRINTPEDVLTVGQEVEARIRQVQTGQRRITLSLKAAQQERETRETRTQVRQVNERAQQDDDGGIRLGDVFGSQLRAASDRGRERNEARNEDRARKLEAAKAEAEMEEDEMEEVDGEVEEVEEAEDADYDASGDTEQ